MEKILDGSRDMQVQTGRCILVKNGKIHDIVPDTADLSGYTKIDLKGHYILPGLINMHVHLAGSGKPQKKQRDGYLVAAHVESPEGVRVALENGVDSIEHGAKLTDEMIKLFKERGTFLCTTISPALPYALFDRSITNATEVEQYNGNVVFEGIIACAKAALANDIPVVLGNDVGCPWITQYDFWRELYYFHKYVGVSNSFALYTATKRSAELAGIGSLTGSIEKGKAADLIVTAQNPLKDLKALRNLEMVMAGGRLIEQPKIKKRKQVEAELDKFTLWIFTSRDS